MGRQILNRKKVCGGVVIAGIVLILMLCCELSFAQGSFGRILGTITDQSGGVIAGATVIVTDVQRGIPRTLTTDQSGEYVAPSLLPGTYTVRAEAKGFKTVERSNLLLEVGKELQVDLSLQPGEQTQTVTVTEQLPLLETTNATLGGTLSNETINELPLNGRNYQNLVTLRPGSLWYPGGGGWTQSTNGSRPEDNGYIVDGLTNDSPLTGLSIINGAGVGGDAATILPIDAIQEFNIVENPPPEYGWKPGAIVSVGLKSGTNSIHGTAYAFGRSDAFDARNYFNPAPSNGVCTVGGAVVPLAQCNKTPVELEQFGATLGGPIKKDKLFYFLAFEDERYNLGNLFPLGVPEDTAGGGAANSLPDALHALVTGGASVGSGISPVSLKLVGCPTPLPAAASPAWASYTCTGGLVYPANNTSSTNILGGFPSVFGSDNGLAKIDYHINDHNTLNGMYFVSRGLITAEDAPYLEPQWRSLQYNRPEVFGANWTWTPNSQWANEARFGYIWMDRATHSLDNNETSLAGYGLNTGVTNPTLGGFPSVSIAGFSTSLGGSVAWPILFGPSATIQVVDNVSYLRGKHAFKFGGELRHNGVTEGRYSVGKGLLFFFGSAQTPLETLLSGTPSFAAVALGTPLLHLTTWQYAGSAADTWRVTPRLTLNIGLRYDYLTPLTDSNNQLGNFNPATGLVQVNSQNRSPYNGDHKDFAPRLGLAWDITGKGTTVLHAGYSIVYDTGLPMFVFIGQGATNNAMTLGLSAIPTGVPIITCPAANANFVTGACSSAATTTNGSGSIQYLNTRVPGSTLAANWAAQTPLFQATTECGDGLSTPTGTNPPPCNVMGMDPNFRTPYVSNWTVGIEHAFTPNLSLNIAYVGNHGSRLPGVTDINQLNQNAPNEQLVGSCGTTHCELISDRPYGSQYPYLGFINWLSNLYISNYNGLQTTLTQRTSHGLSFLAGYTYSHALDDSSFNIDIPLPQDSTQPRLDYDSSVFDITNRFTFSVTYDLPGRNSPGQLLKGWELNSVLTVQNGTPWGAVDASQDISKTGELTDRWDFFGNFSDFKASNSTIPFCTGADFTNPATITCSQATPGGTVTLSPAQTTAFAGACLKAASAINAATVTSLDSFGCYAQGNSVMIPPAVGTFGTMSRDPFRGPGFSELDLSVTKSWKFKERLTAQFRAEGFNILNHSNFTNPYGGSNGFGHNDPSISGAFGCGCATPDQAAGNPVLGTGGARALQLGLKLIF